MPEFPAVGPAVHFPPISVNKNDGPFMREEFLRWLQRQSVQFANLTVTGDIKSSNWDGASPANLASVADPLATMGFYLDSSVGAIQIAGPIYIGRDDRGHIKAYATGVNVFGLDFIDDDLASAASININGDAAAGADLALHSTGTVGVSAVGGLYINNVARDIFLAEPTRLMANDGSTGNVEIFPKGTLITMTTAVDAADQTVSSSETIYDTQTIAVDHANQPVYVDVTITVLWKSMAAGEFVACAPAVMGTRRGDLAWDWPGTNTGGTAPGTNADATSSSSTAHDHTTGAASWNTQDGGAGHTHPGPALNENVSTESVSHSHSHSHTVNSHTHTMTAKGYTTVTVRWCGAITANGSGDVTIGVSAVSGAGTAVMETSTIAYSIWRR